MNDVEIAASQSIHQFGVGGMLISKALAGHSEKAFRRLTKPFHLAAAISARRKNRDAMPIARKTFSKLCRMRFKPAGERLANIVPDMRNDPDFQPHHGFPVPPVAL